VCSVVVYVAAVLCVWVSVCMLFVDFRERQCAVVSVLCRCVAVSLCRCVAVLLLCSTALHWTVAAAVSDSSRAAVVAMLGSLTSGCGAVS
jgi:NADH:ubiquinone oxidoreductase subunit 6 (subunit J)